MIDHIKLNELKKIVKFTLNEKTESCPIGQGKNPFDNKCYNISSLPDGLEKSAEEMYPDASDTISVGELPQPGSIQANTALVFGELVSDDILKDEAIKCSMWSGGMGVATGVVSQGFARLVGLAAKASYGRALRGTAVAALSSATVDTALRTAAEEAAPGLGNKAIKWLVSNKIAAVALLAIGAGGGAYLIKVASKASEDDIDLSIHKFWNKFKEELLNDLRQIPKNYCFWTGIALSFAISKRSRNFFTGTGLKIGNNAYDLVRSILPNAINNGFKAIPEEKLLTEAPELAKLQFLRRVNQLLGRVRGRLEPLKIAVDDTGTKLFLENDVFFDAIARTDFERLPIELQENLTRVFGDTITSSGFRIKVDASKVNDGLDKLLKVGGDLDNVITDAAEKAVKASRNSPAMRALDAISDSFDEGLGFIERGDLVNKLGASIGHTTDELIESLAGPLEKLRRTSAKLAQSELAFDSAFKGGGKRVFQDFIQKNINNGAKSVNEISNEALMEIIKKYGKTRLAQGELERIGKEYIDDLFNLTLERSGVAKGIEFFNSVSNVQMTQMTELLGPNAIDDLLSAPGIRNSIRKNATEVFQNAAPHFTQDVIAELAKNLTYLAGIGLSATMAFQNKIDDDFRQAHSLVNRKKDVERLISSGKGKMSLFDEVANTWASENYKALQSLVLGKHDESSKKASSVGRFILDSFENYVSNFKFAFTRKGPQDEEAYNNEEIKKIFSLYFKGIKDSQFKVDDKSAFQWVGEYLLLEVTK